MELDNKKTVIILLGLLALVIVQCEMDKKANSKNEFTKDWVRDKSQVKNNLEEVIEELNNEITVIEKHIENAPEDYEDKWQKELNRLHASKNDLNEKLSAVEDQTANEWMRFKKDVEKGVEEVKRNIDRVNNKLEQNFEG